MFPAAIPRMEGSSTNFGEEVEHLANSFVREVYLLLVGFALGSVPP
jgi:hypothetical protein